MVICRVQTENWQILNLFSTNLTYLTMAARITWCILSGLFMCVINGVFAELVYRATIGDTVQLSCSTKPGTTVSWQYRGPYTEGDRYLCITGNVLPDYTAKMALMENAQHDYTLTINSVTVNDSGVYTCTEDDGLGQKTSIRLYVESSVVGTSHPVSHSTPAPTDKSSDSSYATVTGLAVSLGFCFAAAVFLLIIVFRTRCAKACRRLLPHGDQTTSLLKDHKEVINKYVFVTGVTILDNKLCMLRGHLVQVYETQSYQLIQGRSFPELHRHYRNDITSKNKCLYISDYLQKCIYTLHLPLKSEESAHKKNVKTEEEKQQSDDTQTNGMTVLCGLKYRPSGLSVTANNEILVTCVNDHKLLLLSPDGKTQREILLETDIELPLHAVQHPTERNRFFVCHSGDGIWLLEASVYDTNETAEPAGSATAQDLEGGQRQNEVSKEAVTAKIVPGSIKGSYGGQTRLGDYKRLGWPCHISVNKAGWVYVADKYNDRVVLLDEELKFVKVVKELERPCRLCLHGDGKDQKLYIGQKNGEVVKIYTQKGGRSSKVVRNQQSENNNKGEQSVEPSPKV